MNLKKGKFKIVEGTRVRMVSSKDTHIVEGAYGTVVSPGTEQNGIRTMCIPKVTLTLSVLKL